MELMEEVVKSTPSRNPEGDDLFIIPTTSDEILAHAYLRFRADGLLDTIFTEGPPTLTWFLETYGKMHVLAAFCGKKLAGLGWINQLQDMGPAGIKGDCGMAFFPEASLKQKLVLGRQMIDWAFETLGLVGLFGTTPAPNRRALAYSRLLGFKLHGPIPNLSAWEGNPCAVYISAMTRTEWEQRRSV
jgi:hypothetical protein